MTTNMSLTQTNVKSFKAKLKYLFDIDSYLFEILAIDIFALVNKQNYIKYNFIFMTKRQCDGGIDAVIIAENIENKIEIIKFQVSLGSKPVDELNGFPEISLNKICPEIMPYINMANKTRNIFLTLGNCSNINKNIEITSGNTFLSLLFSTGINYNLIDKKGFITDEYFLNLLSRAQLWDDYHNYYNSSKDQKVMFNFLTYISILNLERILHNDCNLTSFVKGYKDIEIRTFMNANCNSKKDMYLAYQKFLCLKAPVKITKSIEDLLLFVGESIGFDNSDFVIKPTKKYLSIKDPKSNKAYAHLDWSIGSANSKNAFFGFKGNYESIIHHDKRLKKMIKAPVAVIDSKSNKSKIINKYVVLDSPIRNYLNYTMDIAFESPNLSKDKDLFRELLYKSKI